MKQNSTSIDLKVPADLRFSSGVREFINEFCIYCNFEHTTCNQLKLIIDELFMNAIRYGSGANSQVVVKLSYQNDQVKGVVEDEGKGKEKITEHDLEKIIITQTNNNVITKTSGRGLAQIVKQWTEKMEINNNKSGGITISFEKDVKYKKGSQNIKKDPLLEIKPTSLKEFKFIFEGEIGEENIKENKKIVADFLKSHTGSYRIVLDFEKLYYCNSTFIGQIADWYNKIKKRNGEIIILNPSEDILDIIDMVGLTKVIPIQQTNK